MASPLSASLEHLVMIVALALLTYLARWSGFLIDARRVPPVAERVLAYVPIAAFAALIVPGIAVPGEIAPRVFAAICSGAIALRWGKLWVALLAGVVTYAVLRGALV
jgi:branched-subunit amino acid transport protein